MADDRPIRTGALAAVPSPPSSGPPLLLADLALRIPRVTRRLTTAHATLFLRTRGLLLGRWFGASILVLETVGRRSGKPRRVPVVYLPDGENLAVVPANGGADRPPAWWLNLLAAGEAVALLGRERRRVWPRETTGAERERLWQRFAAISTLDRYQQRTQRRIPVVVLAPAAASAERRASGSLAGEPRLRVCLAISRLELGHRWVRHKLRRSSV